MPKTKGNKKNATKETSTEVTVAEAMTKADYISALVTVGVTPAARAKKDELEKLYLDNLPAIELMGRVKDNKKACAIKSFGAHGTSGLCPKCKTKTKDLYADCAEYQKILGIKKAASKKARKMGHRTGNALWFTRKGKSNNKFCEAILKAGEAGLTMAEVRKARWNPKKYAFNETLTRLIADGFVVRDADGRFKVTDAGIEASGRKKAA